MSYSVVTSTEAQGMLYMFVWPERDVPTGADRVQYLYKRPPYRRHSAPYTVPAYVVQRPTKAQLVMLNRRASQAHLYKPTFQHRDTARLILARHAQVHHHHTIGHQQANPTNVARRAQRPTTARASRRRIHRRRW